MFNDAKKAFLKNNIQKIPINNEYHLNGKGITWQSTRCESSLIHHRIDPSTPETPFVTTGRAHGRKLNGRAILIDVNEVESLRESYKSRHRFQFPIPCYDVSTLSVARDVATLVLTVLQRVQNNTMSMAWVFSSLRFSASFLF